jgi:predicted nucleotidyltransferase
MNRLQALFYSKIRAEVFRQLFSVADKPVYLNQLRKDTGFASRSIEEELKKLQALDLIVAIPDRSRVNFTANKAHPLYNELRSIVLKTSGLQDVLEEALAASPLVDFAFVFGSLARDTEHAASDLDLMVIGTVTNRELAQILRGVSDRIGREINPHIFTREELLQRLQKDDHFLGNVLALPTRFIIGKQDEFEKLVGRRLAPAS